MPTAALDTRHGQTSCHHAHISTTDDTNADTHTVIAAFSAALVGVFIALLPPPSELLSWL
jgi:hypothetical protein